MIFFQGCAQITPVEVGVYLGGGDTFVAHHFLHSAEVCPALYKMCGKRMS